MRIIIDILLLLILAYCTWMGYKKGFINTCVSILAIVVALYAGSLLSSAFSSKIIPAFQPFAGGIIESKEDKALAGLGYDGVSIEDIVAQNPAARTEYCMLTEVRDVMAERNLKLSWDGTVIDYLVKKGYSVIYGARNLRRAIQKDVEDAIAAEIVDRRGEKLTEITLSSDGEKIQIGAK